LAQAVAIPERLSLIAGDAIHNLRSALDYLAYELAEISSPGGFDESRIFFPISDGRDNHEARLRDIRSILRQDAIDALRVLQPYRGGKGHGNTLWCLHRLDILDKHRLLITVGWKFRQWGVDIEWREVNQRVGLPPEVITFENERQWFDPPGSAGARCFDESHVIVVGNGDTESHNKVHFSFDVALREPQIMEVKPLLEMLLLMSDAVDSTLTHFTPFLS
jgi:hypothetical protein